jgi:hypothetical protein
LSISHYTYISKNLVYFTFNRKHLVYFTFNCSRGKCDVNWVIDYLRFSRIFQWWAAKFRPGVVLWAFDQGWVFIVPYQQYHWALVFFGLIRRTAPFIVAFNDMQMNCWGPILTRILTRSHSVASYDTQGDAENLF